MNVAANVVLSLSGSNDLDDWSKSAYHAACDYLVDSFKEVDNEKSV